MADLYSDSCEKNSQPCGSMNRTVHQGREYSNEEGRNREGQGKQGRNKGLRREWTRKEE
jgi:hypothetical protein